MRCRSTREMQHCQRPVSFVSVLWNLQPTVTPRFQVSMANVPWVSPSNNIAKPFTLIWDRQLPQNVCAFPTVCHLSSMEMVGDLHPWDQASIRWWYFHSHLHCVWWFIIYIHWSKVSWTDHLEVIWFASFEGFKVRQLYQFIKKKGYCGIYFQTWSCIGKIGQ